VDLLDLPVTREPVPGFLSREQKDGWLALWERITEEDIARNSLFRENAGHLLKPRKPTPGGTYLLRLCKPGAGNRLTALRILGDNGHGATTLAWRVLHRWPRSTLAEPLSRGRWDGVAPAPEWLWERYEQVDQATIEGWLKDLRERSHGILFGISEERRALYEQVISGNVQTFGTRFGFGRILRRYAYGPLVGEEGDGAYYSFKLGKVAWDEGQIGLAENGNLWGPFAGNLLFDLGDLTFDELHGVIGGSPPPDFVQGELPTPAWTLMRATLRLPGGQVSAEVEAQLKALGLRKSLATNPGHSYLYRNTQKAGYDELVLMTLLEVDGVGVSFAWRVLKSFATR
jgi:hypothetical protein